MPFTSKEIEIITSSPSFSSADLKIEFLAGGILRFYLLLFSFSGSNSNFNKNTGDMKTLFREIDNFASIYQG